MFAPVLVLLTLSSQVALSGEAAGVVDGVTAAVAVRLIDDGVVVVPGRSRAPVRLKAHALKNGGAHIELLAPLPATGAVGPVVDPGPSAVVQLEAQRRATYALAPLAMKDLSGAPSVLSVFIRVRDRRQEGDLDRVRRHLAATLLGAGYGLVPQASAEGAKKALLLCVKLDADVATVGVGAHRGDECQGARSIPRPEGVATAALLTALGNVSSGRLDAIASAPDSFAFDESETTTPFGRDTRGDADEESFADSLAPRRAFVMGGLGAQTRGPAVDPAVRLMARTEHGRRFGLGVVLEVSPAADAIIAAGEATGLVGITYALDLDYGFDAVLGAFGGARAHFYSVLDPNIVLGEGRAADGVEVDVMFAALMGARYRINATYALEVGLLFNFGSDRRYQTTSHVFWERLAGGISATVGLAWELPFFENAAPSDDRPVNSLR